jgi:ubiquinone/menaquinone biosynthesis C-methylase UbiE
MLGLWPPAARAPAPPVHAHVTGTESRSIDPGYLAYQYADAEKLLVRKETHERYSERPNHAFFDWVVDQLALQPDSLVADVGCGPGTYHTRITARGGRIIGLDYSDGMLAESRKLAQTEGHPVVLVRGDAQALPFADRSVDRVLCAQMLYHVPDRERALRELRRVIRPGGLVVLVTGSGDESRLLALHHEIVRDLGYTPGDAGGARFTLKDTALVESVFPNAEVRTFENALVYPNPEAVLRFYASGPVDGIQERTEDGAHRPRLMAAMEARLRPVFKREGALRDPKIYGCFVAQI